MRISVFGLGYVGAVSGACLARMGHDVIGVDINSLKVAMINRGESPIIEKEIPELIADVTRSRRLQAVQDTAAAVLATDVSMICVGTPSNQNGSLDLTYMRRVCEGIGTALQRKSTYHLVIPRSTVLPGTVEEIVIPTLEKTSGRRNGVDFGVCYNPEFMRESSSVQDFFQPPMTVLGGDRGQDLEIASAIYDGIEAPLVRTSFRAAETVKYVCNAFHALKITFANEIGVLCKAFGIDGHEVMEIFGLDKKLNISTTYFKPGFAFGGSCLPKDLRALTYKAKELDLEVPLLGAILATNHAHVHRALDIIMAARRKRIGVLGLSFKPGTDDLRESPMVLLVEQLIGKGYQIRIYDRNISLARLVGSNKEYIEREIPHISSLLVGSITEVLDSCEILVIGNAEAEFPEALAGLRADQVVIDLARLTREKTGVMLTPGYQGIGW